MKKILVAALVASSVLASCSPAPKGVALSDMKSQQDSADYIIGFSMGQQVKQLNFENPNLKNINEGFQAAVNGEELDIMMINQFMGTYIQNMREQAALTAEKAEMAFFAENAKNDSIQTLESGIQYKVIKMGDGVKPAAIDTVKVHYEGKLLNGKVFDSSFARNEPIEFPLNRVIPGWTEALQNMPVGSEWVIYIPSKLGYGAQGAGGEIGPNETLIFNVQLLDVKPTVAK